MIWFNKSWFIFLHVLGTVFDERKHSFAVRIYHINLNILIACAGTENLLWELYVYEIDLLPIEFASMCADSKLNRDSYWQSYLYWHQQPTAGLDPASQWDRVVRSDKDGACLWFTNQLPGNFAAIKLQLSASFCTVLVSASAVHISAVMCELIEKLIRTECEHVSDVNSLCNTDSWK